MYAGGDYADMQISGSWCMFHMVFVKKKKIVVKYLRCQHSYLLICLSVPLHSLFSPPLSLILPHLYLTPTPCKRMYCYANEQESV